MTMSTSSLPLSTSSPSASSAARSVLPTRRAARAVVLLASAAWLVFAAADARAQQANIRLPGLQIDANADAPRSEQKQTAEVESHGGTTTIRNGVISNTQVGRGARATMNIGGRSVEGTHSMTSSSSGGSDGVATGSPRTGAAAGAAVQNGNDYVNQELAGAGWARRDLRRANITNTNLQSADLTGANLGAASLVNVDLSGARLVGANLRGANLVNVDLEDADLSHAVWVDGHSCRAGSIGQCR